MARGYCSVDDVQAHVGVLLTEERARRVYTLIANAEDLIDQWTRRPLGWLTPPVVDEQYQLGNTGGRIYLRHAPVVAVGAHGVQSVIVRGHNVGDVDQVLKAGIDYELQDAQAGLIVFAAAYGTASGYLDFAGSAGFNEAGRLIGTDWPLSSYARVSYQPNRPVPGPIKQAATLLAAHWLFYNLNPNVLGIKRFTVGNQSRSMDDSIAQNVIPAEIKELLFGAKGGGSSYKRLFF